MGDAVKNGVCGMIGLVGSLIASQFGGWDAALSTLVLFMAVDYVTGLVVAGVFHASPKSKTVRWNLGQDGKGCAVKV